MGIPALVSFRSVWGRMWHLVRQASIWLLAAPAAMGLTAWSLMPEAPPGGAEQPHSWHVAAVAVSILVYMMCLKSFAIAAQRAADWVWCAGQCLIGSLIVGACLSVGMSSVAGGVLSILLFAFVTAVMSSIPPNRLLGSDSVRGRPWLLRLSVWSAGTVWMFLWFVILAVASEVADELHPFPDRSGFGSVCLFLVLMMQGVALLGAATSALAAPSDQGPAHAGEAAPS